MEGRRDITHTVRLATMPTAGRTGFPQGDGGKAKAGHGRNTPGQPMEEAGWQVGRGVEIIERERKRGNLKGKQRARQLGKPLL